MTRTSKTAGILGVRFELAKSNDDRFAKPSIATTEKMVGGLLTAEELAAVSGGTGTGMGKGLYDWVTSHPGNANSTAYQV
jgi:hypothetical protein